MHGLRAVRGSLDEFEWFWITQTELFVHTHGKEFMFLKDFKRLVFDSYWNN